jgi:hypothetical protein
MKWFSGFSPARRVERGMELELGLRIGLWRIGNSSRKDYVVTGGFILR